MAQHAVPAQLHARPPWVVNGPDCDKAGCSAAVLRMVGYAGISCSGCLLSYAEVSPDAYRTAWRMNALADPSFSSSLHYVLCQRAKLLYGST